jgi:hypothetical protein
MAIVFRTAKGWVGTFFAVILVMYLLNQIEYGCKNRSQLEGSVGIGF